MGRIAILLVVAAASLMPVIGTAAPGNPLAELRREETKFQGMYVQLNTWYCGSGGGSGPMFATGPGGSSVDFAGLLRTLNSRRAQAYRQRGQSVPSSFFYDCGDDDDDDGAPEIRQR